MSKLRVMTFGSSRNVRSRLDRLRRCFALGTDSKLICHIVLRAWFIVRITCLLLEYDHGIFAASILVPYSYQWVPCIKSSVDRRFGYHGLAFVAGAIFLSTTFSYALIYLPTGLIDQDLPNEALSIETAYYFSIVTITTLGFGDIRPSVASRLVAASESVSGLILIALCLSVGISSFRSKDSNAS
jgi:Ion channel